MYTFFIVSNRKITKSYVNIVLYRYLNKGRSITMDNYFTSLHLAERLAAQNTTSELPAECKTIATRQRGDAQHFYCGSNTLCPFWDKGTKPVLLLSLFYNGHGAQENTIDQKPQMVVDYNSTKAGVDNLDKLVRGFRSKRKCRRWPYGVFFSLLDVAVIAAHQLFKQENDESHYVFKRELAYELAMPFVHRRVIVRQLTDATKQAMKAIGIQISQPVLNAGAIGPIRQGRCHLCPRARDKKSRSRCYRCHNFACSEHSMVKCLHC